MQSWGERCFCNSENLSICQLSCLKEDIQIIEQTCQNNFVFLHSKELSKLPSNLQQCRHCKRGCKAQQFLSTHVHLSPHSVLVITLPTGNFTSNTNTYSWHQRNRNDNKIVQDQHKTAIKVSYAKVLLNLTVSCEHRYCWVWFSFSLWRFITFLDTSLSPVDWGGLTETAGWEMEQGWWKWNERRNGKGYCRNK